MDFQKTKDNKEKKSLTYHAVWLTVGSRRDFLSSTQLPHRFTNFVFLSTEKKMGNQVDYQANQTTRQHWKAI